METVKKILLVSPKPPPVGGIASWTLHILKHFNEKHDQIKLLHLNSALKRGIIVNRKLSERIIDGIKDFTYLYKQYSFILNTELPDVVHITSSASLALIKDFFLIKKTRKQGCCCVIHFRFGRIPQLRKKNNWEWKLLKKVIQLSDKCIVIDTRSLKILKEAGFNHVYYLSNPVSSDFIPKPKQLNDFKEREKGVVLFVGHVKKEKGILDLANACVQLGNIEELRIIGPFDQETKDKLGLIEAMRKNKWIRLLGVQNSSFVINEMRRCSLFVLPSYTEGFPNVILEAMIMACPIIATEVGAIPEMLQFHSDEEAGVCVPVGDVVALKHAICQLSNDDAKSTALGLRAKKIAIENYTIDHIGNQLLKIWNG